MKHYLKSLVRVFGVILILSFTSCVTNKTVSKEEINKFETVNVSVDVTYSPCRDEIKELFLQKGDKIAVILTSSLSSKAQVERTMKGLADLGYVPVMGKYVLTDMRTLEQCKEDLLWALNDEEIKAIFCVRGGYGGTEVMDEVSLEDIRKANKLIIGYSDVTVFHSAWTSVGIPSVHATMSEFFNNFDEKCFEVEKRILEGEIPKYKCERSEFCVNGTGKGKLIGGNLATYTAVLGSHYDSSQFNEPYILYFEDVGENITHIHRYLTALKHMGVLKRAQGIIFGEWTEVPDNTSAYTGNSRGKIFDSIDEMISRQFLSDLDIPVVFAFPAGHGDENYPLLMGETVTLEVTDEGYSIHW